jgi:large subunit ribosomal protein L10
MKMRKEQKVESIKLAEELLSTNDMCILIDYKGLSAGEITNLRTLLKDKEANLKVFKNTLTKRAIEGKEFSALKDVLKNQVALSYSKDPLVLANVIMNYMNENGKIKVLSGIMNGKVIDVNTIKELSKLGSVNDVRARFIGVLKAPGSKLAQILDAYAKKDL